MPAWLHDYLKIKQIDKNIVENVASIDECSLCDQAFGKPRESDLRPLS